MGLNSFWDQKKDLCKGYGLGRQRLYISSEMVFSGSKAFLIDSETKESVLDRLVAK